MREVLVWRTVDGYPIRRCDECQHSFLGIELAEDHVDHQYGDAYFTGGGSGYSDYRASFKVVSEHVRQYVALMQRHAAQSQSVIAIGSAAGFDLLPFKELGWQAEGIEPNAEMCRLGREKYELTMHHSTLEEFEPERRFDLVLAIQVMGHFVDPVTAARRMSELVEPGGLVLIETWNVNSRMARMLGTRWHEYSPPSVTQWFSPRSLERLMIAVGLQRIDSGRPSKWIRGDHAASLLSHKLGNYPTTGWLKPLTHFIPKRLVLPYPAEDLFWMLFRK